LQIPYKHFLILIFWCYITSNNSLFSPRFSPSAIEESLRYLHKFSKDLRILIVKSKCSQEETKNVVRFAASRLPKLVRLDVGGTICDKNLFRSLLRLKYLRHLNVDVSDEVLKQKFNHISPSILTLQLDSEFGPRSGALKKLVSWCPGIQSLSLNLYEISTTPDDAGLLALAKGLPHLRILRILYFETNIRIKPVICLSPGGVLRFAKLRGRDLFKLSLPLPSDFTLNHFQDLLASCPSLLETDFWFQAEETDPAMRSALDIVLPQTKMNHVTLTDMPSAWLGPFTRSIAATVQTLSLRECAGLTFTQIMGVVNECNSLEDLHLHLCCCCDGLAMSSKGRVAVGGGSQTVKHLSLEFCDNDVDLKAPSMARKVLELCRGVRKMKFLEGNAVSPVALLLDRLPSLEELELSMCKLAYPPLRSASETSGGFPHLKSITFESCVNVSDCMLAEMAELSPRLSHLFVDGDYLEEYEETFPSFSGLRRLLGRVETKKLPSYSFGEISDFANYRNFLRTLKCYLYTALKVLSLTLTT
jgi:hypothetical protein